MYRLKHFIRIVSGIALVAVLATAANAGTTAPAPDNLTSRELLAGVFFGVGPGAKVFVPLSDGLLEEVKDPEAVALAWRITDASLEADADLSTTFVRDMYSGDAYRVNAALTYGGSAVKTQIIELGELRDSTSSPDANNTWSVNVDVFLNAVLVIQDVLLINSSWTVSDEAVGTSSLDQEALAVRIAGAL